MQFTFNGNMDEIREFVSYLSLAEALDTEIEKVTEPTRVGDFYIESLSNLEHYSHTQLAWIKYGDMHPVYLLNLIRKSLFSVSSKEALVDQHFLAAVLALANKIVEENQGYENNPECPL